MSFAKCLRLFAPSVVRPRLYGSVLAAKTISGNRFFSRTATTTQAKLVVTEGGNRLQAVWSSDSGATPSNYHAVWLRHNCQCPTCLSEYNQQLVEAHELDPHVKISDVKLLSDGDVKIVWSSGHEGHVNLDWLRRHCYSHHSLEERRKECLPEVQKQVTLPTVEAEELKDEKGVLKWLKLLGEHGMCLLTGLPCTEEAGYELSRKISPHLQETFYGGLTKVIVWDDPINVSYGSDKLDIHMDLIQYESQVGVILLHCLRNDECVEGGETVVVDLLAVMENMRANHPQHFDTLVRVPTTFHRIHYDRDYPVHMIYRTPHVQLNKHGDIVKLRWCSFNHGPLQVPEEDVQPYYEAFSCLAKSIKHDQPFQIRRRLKPGEVWTMNNHRMVHGRTSVILNGGFRHLNNFALNIDEFKSRLQVLSAKYDPDYQPKNVFNHDFCFSAPA